MDHSTESFQPPEGNTPQFSLDGWVTGLAQAFVAGVERQTEAHGLTAAEFTLLGAFMKKRERTLLQLGESIPIDRERLTQLVGRLVDRGLLHWRGRTAEPRAKLLSLTQQGRYTAWRLHSHVQAAEWRLLEGVSEEEIATLSSVVSKIVANHVALEQAGPQ